MAGVGDELSAVDGLECGVYIPTGPIVINEMPQLGLTIFGVTIEPLDGEALDDTKQRLANALLESLPQLGGLRVLGTTTSGELVRGLARRGPPR